MALPKFFEFFKAFLVVLQDGELHKMSEVRSRIAEDMHMTNDEADDKL